MIKPAISADGCSTERASRERAASDQPVLDAMLARGDVVVQQLVPEIRTNGEISMMFFSGAFSHAVSKRPRAGEFRVQERLGGQAVVMQRMASRLQGRRFTKPPPCINPGQGGALQEHSRPYIKSPAPNSDPM